uniref:Uncharacterized protein n=1 Tax=Tanacetum cinerariifolium TaxID=118510 RepID=A0A699GT07_TANCI|nr:hypothetical protein [Tanacetum cinerariifolium]
MNENKSFNENPANHALYHVIMKALIKDEIAMDKRVADTIKNHKRQHDDDKHPSAGPNQGKRRRTKESESSMKPSTTKKTSRGKAPSKSSKTGKSASAKEPVEEPIAEVEMDNVINTANKDMVHDVYQPQDDSTQAKDKDPKKDCPEGDRYPFDLTKPLPLKGCPDHLTVVVEYFFNNDLEFLKASDPEKKYTTSITKAKAARYEIVGIEDMVPTLWSTTKVGYVKDAKRGSSTRVTSVSYGINLSVKSISVKKQHGYGHLEDIVVRRADRQLYKFKKGDFVNLHLNDIEDMLLLVVQHKLFQLDGSNIVDLIVALRMFTRSHIIKRRFKDLQLGVESYQKKLNITEP